jgi:hypothetical protein
VFVYTYLYLLYRFFLSLTVLILCTRVQSVMHVYVYMSYFFVDFLLISHTGFLLICHIGSPKRGPGERGGKRRREEAARQRGRTRTTGRVIGLHQGWVGEEEEEMEEEEELS